MATPGGEKKKQFVGPGGVAGTEKKPKKANSKAVAQFGRRTQLKKNKGKDAEGLLLRERTTGKGNV